MRARSVWAFFLCPHSIRSGLVSICIFFHNMYIYALFCIFIYYQIIL
nr:MAG TPA: hypothetical protein [Caudoviricetes sp.]